MNKQTSWGSVAGWYDNLLEENEGTYQKEVILPNLLRLVDPQRGDDILDLACGQGFFSRALAEKGATVTATDISLELIELAKKNAPENVNYEVAPADQISFASENSFNKAVIVLALQNIEHLQGTIQEVMRTLKPGGTFHIVLNHPTFRIPGFSNWNEGIRLSRQIDSYMSESTKKIDMTPGEKDPSKKKWTISFHRPLQVYFKALNKAGFTVSRLEEWISHKKSQEGPRAPEEDRIRKEIPLFLYIEARKI